MTSAAMAIELCSLCPIEPACERRQMLEHFGGRARAHDDAQATPPAVKGQPYRCWLLESRDSAKTNA